MLPDSLLPDSVAYADGQGLEMELGPKRGKLLVLTGASPRSLNKSVWKCRFGGLPTARIGARNP
jgi:hypothetical protein